MRVGLDIDDVLYPWYVTAHDICVRAGLGPAHPMPTTWRPYEDYGCTDQEWFDALAEATVSGDLYCQPPMDGVNESLSRLVSAGHTVHLVTARGFMQHGALIREQTIQWLDRFEIPHHSLTFAKDKRAVITDVFLDDAEHNYDQLYDHTKVWLLHAPHNWAARDGRFTVATLDAFVDLVLAMPCDTACPPCGTRSDCWRGNA